MFAVLFVLGVTGLVLAVAYLLGGAAFPAWIHPRRLTARR